MIYFVLIVIFIIAGFLLGFGDYGRGTWSVYISTSAGLVWLGGIIYSFISYGLFFGLITIPTSFVIASISMFIGKKLVLSLRKI